jgi:hypothetical protein
METRAAGVTVAVTAPSPADAVRYHAVRRTPVAPLTLSYALVQPFMATVDVAGVRTVVTSTAPGVVPAGRGALPVELERADEVVARPTWLTPAVQVSVAAEALERTTPRAVPAHA